MTFSTAAIAANARRQLTSSAQRHALSNLGSSAGSARALCSHCAARARVSAPSAGPLSSRTTSAQQAWTAKPRAGAWAGAPARSIGTLHKTMEKGAGGKGQDQGGKPIQPGTRTIYE